MYHRCLVLVLGLGLLLPVVGRAEVFVDAFTGKPFTGNADLHIEQSSRGKDYTFHDVGFEDRSFELPPYYGVRAGYFFETHPWLGVGVEFFHFKIYAQTDESKRVRRRSGFRTGGCRSTVAAGWVP